jgi:hypothetical protein
MHCKRAVTEFFYTLFRRHYHCAFFCDDLTCDFGCNWQAVIQLWFTNAAVNCENTTANSHQYWTTIFMLYLEKTLHVIFPNITVRSFSSHIPHMHLLSYWIWFLKGRHYHDGGLKNHWWVYSFIMLPVVVDACNVKWYAINALERIWNKVAMAIQEFVWTDWGKLKNAHQDSWVSGPRFEVRISWIQRNANHLVMIFHMWKFIFPSTLYVK